MLNIYGTHLGNVFGFHQIIHVEQDLDGDPELEQVIDDSLNPVLSLHLISWGGPLLFAKRGWAAFEYNLLNNPEISIPLARIHQPNGLKLVLQKPK